VLALFVTGCTADTAEDVTSAYDTHVDFITAWNEGDYETMDGLLSPDASETWSGPRLANVAARIEEAGQIEEVVVELEGTPPSPDAEVSGSATFDFLITYTSAVTTQPVALSGELPLVFDEEEESWTIDWDRSLFFPGISGARGFEVTSEYPPRAPLLDRKGRKMASGPAEEREYPFDSAAGTTIGHLEPVKKPVKKSDIPEGDAHRPGDLVGASGLEEAFEDRLAGTPTTKLRVVDRRGRVLDTVGRRSGRRARPLRTTLDMRIQQAAEAAYGSTTGGAVVLDPRTGDILAAVASSPFDPGNYVGVPGIEPFNRALSGLYPPGSSLKAMTAAAALDSGEVKAGTQLTGPAEYKGVRNFESGAFGTLSFASALQNSVNTAFAQVAEDLGARKLTRYAELFGFNEAPATPLDVATSSFPFPEDEGDLMWGSIGQAQVLATPLQMASVAATIANDGIRMEPRAVLSEERSKTRVMSRKTARILTGLMESVVQGGTGVAAQISGVRVAGKTGTAEVDVAGERRNHAWFICFAPANRPRVAIAVVSEYGGVGGQVAAPLARAILQRVLPLLP
jgi:penicillin-binding protein A